MQASTSGPLTFPPEDLGLEVDLLGSGTTRPETGAQVVARLHPDALICGPMFEIPSGQGYGSYDVAKLIYRYLDARIGVNLPGIHPDRGGTISVVGNRAEFHSGNAIQPGATFAIQGYPSLVESGRSVVSAASHDTQAEGRCAVGITADGQAAFCLATLSMAAFATKMVDAGVKWAAYMDGGSSAAIQGGGFGIGLNARRLPAYVIAKRGAIETVVDGGRAVGGAVADTVTHSPATILLPLLIVGGLAWYMWSDAA